MLTAGRIALPSSEPLHNFFLLNQEMVGLAKTQVVTVFFPHLEKGKRTVSHFLFFILFFGKR